MRFEPKVNSTSPTAFCTTPNTIVSQKFSGVIARLDAKQKQKAEQSQAEAPIAGSIWTSWFCRSTMAVPASDRLMKTASKRPKFDPSPPPLLTITMTPISATAAAIYVEREGLSPIKTKASAAVAKGAVA